MPTRHDLSLSKVPEVTLGFWIIKIAATTLGETGGDAVTMTLNFGYLVGTAIFATIFIALVAAEIGAKKFHPFLYWAVIVATTTVGTTMADFFDRSLGIGYIGGSTILFVLLIGTLALWYAALGTVSVASIRSPKAETFYWATILFSQTLGTALVARPLLCVGRDFGVHHRLHPHHSAARRAPSGRGRAGSRAGVRQAALMSVLVDRLRTQSLRPFVPMLDAAAPAIPVQRVGSPRDEPLCVSAPPDRRLRCPRERGAAPLLIQVSKYWMPCWARLHRLTYLAREAIPAVRA
jgi:hypothetical protein